MLAPIFRACQLPSHSSTECLTFFYFNLLRLSSPKLPFRTVQTDLYGLLVIWFGNGMKY